MKPTDKKTADTPMRRAAEKRLATATATKSPTKASIKNATDTQRILHELQVHQVELEMQNEELYSSRETIENLLSKYSDLYDFAPVGYLSIDETCTITNLNLTAASLLGDDRDKLIDHNLPRFFTPDCRPGLLEFLKHVFSQDEGHACQAKLLRSKRDSIDVNVYAKPTTFEGNTKKICQIVIADITELKQAQESGRKLEIATATNQALQAEIQDRKTLEKELRKGELHLVHLLNESQEMHSQLQRISHKMLSAQEEGREQLGKEMHQLISTALTRLNQTLSHLQKKEILNDPNLPETISKTRKSLKQAIQVVQQSASKLKLTELDDHKLIPALRKLIKTLAEQTGIRAHLSAFAEVEDLDKYCRTTIFRITQEALENVARHAQASQVDVEISQQAGILCLKISDDGKSFEVLSHTLAPEDESFGLLAMRDQVERVGGQLKILSAPEEGTKIIAQIPLN
jgi:PAS domain S-box-containing protein